LSRVRESVQLESERLSQAPDQIRRLSQEIFRRERERLENHLKETRLKDPRKLLERGYSIRNVDGKIVKSVEQVEAGQNLEAQLRDGTVSARVLEKRKGSL
jgi:exodeoxyribonuclease VII large subunit